MDKSKSRLGISKNYAIVAKTSIDEGEAVAEKQQVHLVIYAGPDYREVKAVYFDKQKAKDHRDRYLKAIDESSIWRKLHLAMNTRRETAFVETHEVKS